MKRMMLLLAFCGLLTTAMADWTYGTARFTGSQPSSCLHHGSVIIWYNGTLTQKQELQRTTFAYNLHRRNCSGSDVEIKTSGMLY